MTLEEIVNGNYKVTEKQKLLNEFKEQILEEIHKAEIEIKKGYKYCPKCGEYYKEKAWETEYKTGHREVCTFHSLAEFDDDTYEYKDCIVTYSICPMGHRIEDYVQW